MVTFLSRQRILSHIRNKSYIHTYVFKMDKAYLRHTTDTFDFSFHLTIPENKVDRRFNFSRRLDEPISTFLTRIVSNVEKVITKKKKRKKGVETSNEELPITASLLQSNIIIQDDTLCGNVFKKDDKNIILRLLDRDYAIIVNAPYIDTISLPNSILANFPVYPCKFEGVFTERSLCEYHWYTSKDKKSWTKVGDGYIFTPSNSDVNSYLKLACTPKNGKEEGPIIETISDVTIAASPGECPFELRHAFTSEKCTKNEFRVVTYNILADLYCDSEFTRTILHPYCPTYALKIDYRKQLIIKEILGYQADIICLQEVDKKVYTYDLDPVLSSLKYNSDFSLKGGEVAEGLACFYDTTRFRFLEKHSMVLAEELGNNPIFTEIFEKICTNEKLKERILSRATILQIVILENISTGNIVLVANTHLYFHPDADHIRLLQGYINILYIQDIYVRFNEKCEGKNVSVIFCGDFNSVPECGIYKLYTSRKCEDCIDLKSNAEESINDLNFYQNFTLASACGTPKYTNFTAGFQDCLDYIYYDKSKLTVSQVIPLPTHQELIANIALPSIVFPSDHISLVADLKFL